MIETYAIPPNDYTKMHLRQSRAIFLLKFGGFPKASNDYWKIM